MPFHPFRSEHKTLIEKKVVTMKFNHTKNLEVKRTEDTAEALVSSEEASQASKRSFSDKLKQAIPSVTLDDGSLKLDSEVGSIETGKHADFAILEDDPESVDPTELKDVRVWGTVQAGRIFPASEL